MMLKKDSIITNELRVKHNELLLLSNFLEVKFKKENGFRVVRETLNRICIEVDNVFNQACHIYYRRNKYYIVHWSEMRALDSEEYTNINEKNLRLRNKVAELLVKYDLVKIVNVDAIKEWIYIDKKQNQRSINITNNYVKFKVLTHEESLKNKIKVMDW